MQELKLKVSRREVFGKKAKKHLGERKIMGNVYGRGVESVAVEGNYHTIAKAYKTAGKTQPVELEIEGADDHLVLFHEVDVDPVTQKMHHVTFYIVRRDEKVTAEVPIQLVGDSPAEHTGKIIVTLLDAVEVEALPTHLPDHFEVDKAKLEDVGDQITVADITSASDVTIVAEPDTLIAKVDLPRAEIEEEAEEAEELEAGDVPSDHGGDEDEASEEAEDQSAEASDDKQS